MEEPDLSFLVKVQEEMGEMMHFGSSCHIYFSTTVLIPHTHSPL